MSSSHSVSATLLALVIGLSGGGCSPTSKKSFEHNEELGYDIEDYDWWDVTGTMEADGTFERKEAAQVTLRGYRVHTVLMEEDDEPEALDGVVIRTIVDQTLNSTVVVKTDPKRNTFTVSDLKASPPLVIAINPDGTYLIDGVSYVGHMAAIDAALQSPVVRDASPQCMALLHAAYRAKPPSRGRSPCNSECSKSNFSSCLSLKKNTCCKRVTDLRPPESNINECNSETCRCDEWIPGFAHHDGC